MERQKVTRALLELFAAGKHLIFWHDEDREFADLVPSLELPNVELVDLAQASALEIKLRVANSRDGHFLFYAPYAAPAPADDWLLDLRLQGHTFSADRASILLAELGLSNMAMKNHLRLRKGFLASKDRVKRLRRIAQPNDNEVALDLKILAVLSRSDQADFFSVLVALLAELEPTNLDRSTAALKAIEKFGLASFFWQQVAEHFCPIDDTPTLNGLLLRMMVSELAHDIDEALPEKLAHLTFAAVGRGNSAVCLARWRDSATRHGQYETLACAIADLLDIDHVLVNVPASVLSMNSTFLQVDRTLLRQLRDALLGDPIAGQLTPLLDHLKARKSGFWVTDQFADSDSAPRSVLRAAYDALAAAINLLELAKSDKGELRFSSARQALNSYQQRWFQFDQLYRWYCEHADTVKARDLDLLKALSERIEDIYGNGFLAKLATGWGGLLETELLQNWHIADTPNQQNFFASSVDPILALGEERRVFVVISDALRYEAAQELCSSLNGRYRIKAEIAAQLGVLPSYTGLGMAALLPHKKLAYDAKGSIRLDDITCAGLKQRKKILAKVNGIAIKADDFMKLTKDEGRASTKPYRVVYIYHDHIDAVGDSASTESQTFQAVRKAIDELGDIVSKVINSLNGSHVLVTADHGFLFQNRPPDELDKSRVSKPSGAVLNKKRYILGRNMGQHESAYCGHVATTAGDQGSMEYWLPKGNNRFNFVGGARFVHGGAMLQEIVVPIISVQHTRGAKGEKTRIKDVGVSVLGSNFKITTNRHFFNLIQTEAVTSRVRAATLKIAIYDDDEVVSNIETVTFDSTSSDMNQWKKSVRMTLQARPFSPSKTYLLIMRQATSDVEVARYDVSIDLAFSNDF